MKSGGTLSPFCAPKLGLYYQFMYGDHAMVHTPFNTSQSKDQYAIGGDHAHRACQNTTACISVNNKKLIIAYSVEDQYELRRNHKSFSVHQYLGSFTSYFFNF